MENQFSFDEQPSFDFKVLLAKILKNWKWYLVILAIAFFIAHYINVRKQNIYELKNYVTVKDESNPWFTSNMSLVFNWGGVSDKVDLFITTLKSRTHNERVVKQLKSYINYYKKGKYNLIDIYDESPFVFEMDETQPQIINVPVKIKFTSNESFKLSIEPKNKTIKTYNYSKNAEGTSKSEKISKEYQVGELIDLPYFHGKIIIQKPEKINLNDTYSLILKNFHATVNKFKDELKVKPKNKNSSILILSLKGTNKKRIADYLNTTTSLLQGQILNDKNKFAVNTIKFIDSILVGIQNDLTNSAKSLKKFVKGKTVLNLDDPSSKLYEKITNFDLQKNTLLQKKMYYKQLLDYLQNKKNYEDLPAPTVVGIDDPTVVQKVSKITQLAILRKKSLTTFKENSLPVQKIDLEIESLRRTLLETVNSALYNIESGLRLVNKNIATVERSINKLPEEKQTLLTLKRNYDLKEEVFNELLKKRNEASIVKASNVSDLKIIDNAKDTGQAPVAPNRKINYLIALLAGLLLPTMIIFVLFLLDNKIHDISELEEMTKTPILGRVYHYEKKGGLPVIDEPKGVVTEAFRSLRSSLRFIFPPKIKSQAVMVTSTISGEGKTFVSSNLALIHAMGSKKTALLEFDLRKPKFKEYFDEAKHPHTGLVDYLSGDAEFNDIIVSTKYENLDLILSGSIPPNPSELIIRDYTQKLFDELKTKYDFIIVDVPPIGLVSDALEIQKFVDVMLFIVRENYSMKDFVKDIDEKYENKKFENIAIIYNDLKMGTFKKYGYGKNYGYGYGNYFQKKQSLISKILSKFK